MSRKLKIMLGISIPIILIVTVIVLIVLEILPNPFLDTKDLVCKRESNFGDFVQREERIISFNKKAQLEKIVEKYYTEYSTTEEAQTFYEMLVAEKILNKNLKIKDNVVIEEFEQKDLKNFVMYQKNKKEVKEYYELEFEFNCE